VTSQSVETTVGHLLRDLAPQVLGAVARRHGDFDAAEDAVQEALLFSTKCLSLPKCPIDLGREVPIYLLLRLKDESVTPPPPSWIER
jgi:hypothetical protein